MTKDQTFATDLAHFCHHQHWDLDRVTTATALVVNLEQNSYTGILWDLAATNLDTTIATPISLDCSLNSNFIFVLGTGCPVSSSTFFNLTLPFKLTLIFS